MAADSRVLRDRLRFAVCPLPSRLRAFARVRQIDRWLKLHMHVERLGLKPMLAPDEAAKVRRHRIGKGEQQRGHRHMNRRSLIGLLVSFG
jgi:hypothetical protein